MKTLEQNFWDRVRKNLFKMAITPSLSFQRFEDMTKAGVPDVMVICEGRETWIELKIVRAYPAKNRTPVLGGKGLSQEQKNWHLTHRRNGGLVCTLIGVGKTDLFLVDGRYSDVVNTWSKLDLELGSACDKQGPQIWEQIYRYLRVGMTLT